jgi:RNA polymerase sigma-70 factor (ECF subfamily)
VGPEERIECLRARRDLHGAATQAIETYGPELFGFLVTVLRSESDASEVYSQACEDMWRGLPGFQGRCSLRTWLYALTKHAISRFKKSPHERMGRAGLSEVGAVAERVRSQTVRHLRTSVKDKFAAIRDSLTEDERALLVLRVDRGMSWREIALTCSVDDPSEDALRRRESALRKQFQRVKETIHLRAKKAGLLESREADGPSERGISQ